RVVPDDRENVEAPVKEVPQFGITASNLTSWSAKELKRTSRAGVRVHGVRPGGPADEARPSLGRDDVIVSLDGTAVTDLASLNSAIDRVTRSEDSASPVLVTFDRRSGRLMTVLEIGRAGLQDPGLEARKAWVPVSVQVVTRELA